LLWIDAICINQENSLEKGHQIKLMGQIYKNASRVLVWLGTGDQDSELAFNSLEQLAVSAERFGLRSLDAHKWFELPRLKGDADDILKVLQLLRYDKLDSIYSRSWFERLWVP